MNDFGVKIAHPAGGEPCGSGAQAHMLGEDSDIHIEVRFIVAGAHPSLRFHSTYYYIIRSFGNPRAVIRITDSLAALCVVGAYHHYAPRLAVACRGRQMCVVEHLTDFIG